MSPRKAVLRRYAADHDRFAEQEQLLVGAGDYVKAEGAHWYGDRVVRAYRAEMDDPAPEQVRCNVCLGLMRCDTDYHLSIRVER